MPIDSVYFPTLIRKIVDAVLTEQQCLISTPNVNFLIKSQDNIAFRETILSSNLCLADGMPLIWIAKLLQIPIRERVAGADLFGRLKALKSSRLNRRLRVFLLGGAEGLAEKVARQLNGTECGLECVGFLNPGFGSISDLSTDEVLSAINSSRADLLAVFFGAEKAQAWLLHNHHRLTVPVRAQFGATINFEAGAVKRAPLFLRSTGFEWLWRIKEEPYLWRRYWKDGIALLRLLTACVLPLVVGGYRRRQGENRFSVLTTWEPARTTLGFVGAAIDENADRAISALREALARDADVDVDLSRTETIDARFFGLLLMMRKKMSSRGKRLQLYGESAYLRRLFRLNRFEYLLSS